MHSSPFIPEGQVLDFIRLRPSRVHRLGVLRRAGLIPECVAAGKFNLYPTSDLLAIKARLLASGHLTPEDFYSGADSTAETVAPSSKPRRAGRSTHG